MGKYFKIWITYRIICYLIIICDQKNAHAIFWGFLVNYNPFSFVILRHLRKWRWKRVVQLAFVVGRCSNTLSTANAWRSWKWRLVERKLDPLAAGSGWRRESRALWHRLRIAWRRVGHCLSLFVIERPKVMYSKCFHVYQVQALFKKPLIQWVSTIRYIS